MSSSEVSKYVDSAMFKAEPLVAADGPKVYLLWMTPDPLGAIAAMAKMYKGEVVRNMAREITDAERLEYFEQIQKTKLQAPLESVQLHFMVEGVTRAFTHQMVRQRTAAYAQESLRFAVKENMAESVALPPSLAGTKDTSDMDPGGYADWSPMQRARYEWDDAVETVADRYQKCIDLGMPAEDARGLLPHNITTRLNYITDLRALLDHGGNRLCTQAQFEWRMVWVKLIEAIRSYRPPMQIGPNSAGVVTNESQAWQFDKVAGIFRPACYLTGKCEFKANFDRKCSIRDRVDAFHEHGVPSERWELPLFIGTPGAVHPGPMAPWATKEGQELVPGIDPKEWLLDAGAAR